MLIQGVCRPLVLEHGDEVAIIAPASQLPRRNRRMLDEAQMLLESWGLRVRILCDRGNHFYLAGHDDRRAQHLTDVITDSRVKAIFCLRGGYGSARTIRALKDGSDAPRKLLIGYSDVCALHLYAEYQWPNVQSIHGPNIATEQLLGASADAVENRKLLRDCLFQSPSTVHELEFIRPGVALAPIKGGCLSMISSSLGTPYAPNFRNCIAFIEDKGEAPYKIDRMLTHAIVSGAFEGVRGFVFGEMSGCEDQYNSIDEVILDVLSDFAGPIAKGFLSGHSALNIPIRLGFEAELESARSSLRLLS